MQRNVSSVGVQADEGGKIEACIIYVDGNYMIVS